MTDKQALRYLSPVKTLMKRLDFDKHYIEALETAMQALKDKGKTEVLQGEWINICTLPIIRKCSLCGNEIGNETGFYNNFCPNCGAEMRNITKTPSSSTTTNPNSVEAYHQSLKGGAE